MIEKKNTPIYLLIITIVIMIMTDQSHALAVPMKRGEPGEPETIPPFESVKNVTTNASPAAISSTKNFPVGKLTMKDPSNGQLKHCTGSVINTENGNVVVTAAHCLVNEDGRVVRNIMFSPGFDHGQDGPLGQIGPAKVLKVPDTFLTNRKIDDYGLVRFDYRTRDGRNLQQVTGALGFKFNVGNNIQTTSFGYPIGGNIDSCSNDGNNLCSFSVKTQLLASNIYLIPNKEWGGGASGGPWIMDYDPTTNLGHLYANTESGDERGTFSAVYEEDTFRSLLDFVIKN